uniref:Protein kinase domain-containing protein n=1 Tax=Calcidiscus leptoporus TaxID=127549 RepID=A0A7S0NXQ0_9EUKA
MATREQLSALQISPPRQGAHDTASLVADALDGTVACNSLSPLGCASESDSSCSAFQPMTSATTASAVTVDFDVLQTVLGKGEFSEVRLGLRKGNMQRVAVKVIQKRRANPQRLQAEVSLLFDLAKLSHPNLVLLYAAYESKTELNLVLEYLAGGTLLQLLKSSEGGALEEEVARQLVGQIGSGLRQLHMAGVVHRDLKLDNVMLDGQGTPKICDFGFAKRCSSVSWETTATRFASSPCGTPGFVAPEVLSNTGYDFAVDLWALGIITFVLLCGKPPFEQGANGILTPKGSASPKANGRFSSSSPIPIAMPIAGPASPVLHSPRLTTVLLEARAMPQASAERGSSPIAGAPDGRMDGRWRREIAPDLELPLPPPPRSGSGLKVASSASEDERHREQRMRWASVLEEEQRGEERRLRLATALKEEKEELAESSVCHRPPAAASPAAPAASRLLARMKRGWDFPPRPEKGSLVSDAARAFVTGLLQEDPPMRLTSEQVVQHPWVTGSSPSGRRPSRPAPRESAAMLLAHTARMPRPDCNSPRPAACASSACASSCSCGASPSQETGSELPRRQLAASRPSQRRPRQTSMLPDSDEESDEDERSGSPQLMLSRRRPTPTLWQRRHTAPI